MDMIRRFTNIFRPHYLSGVLLIIILIFSTIITVLTPFLYQKLVDIGIYQHNIRIVIYLVIVIALFMIAQECLFLLQTKITLRLRELVFLQLKHMLYSKLMNLPQSYYTEQHKGGMLSRLTSDINAVQSLFLDRFVFFVKNILVGIAILTIMFMIQWKMVLLTMLFMPVLYGLYLLFRRKISSLSQENQEQQELLMERMQEDLAVIQAFQSFSVLNERMKSTTKYITAAESARKRLDMHYSIASSSTVVINLIGIIVIWGLGAIEVMNERMTIGTLIAISFFLNYMINLFYSAYYTVIEFQGAIPAARRIFEVIDTKSELLEENTVVDRNFTKTILKMENVSFSYTKYFPILKNVNIAFNDGDVVGIVGASGQGKTTFINLLQRFMDPKEGRIMFDNIDIRKIKLETLRRTVAVIPQEDLLLNQSLKDNIIFYRSGITEDQFLKACELSKINNFIHLLPNGYDTIIGERGAKLSGGQKKRISIARALLEDPYVLVLDEATSMLDESTEHQILESIMALAKDKIILLITHKISNLNYVDQVIQIKDGTVTQIPTTNAVMLEK